jgi:hypothetical protein
VNGRGDALEVKGTEESEGKVDDEEEEEEEEEKEKVCGRSRTGSGRGYAEVSEVLEMHEVQCPSNTQTFQFLRTLPVLIRKQIENHLKELNLRSLYCTIFSSTKS